MGNTFGVNCCNEGKTKKKDEANTVMLEDEDTHNKKSLYEELGGQEAIALVVNEFYKNVMSDDRVNHFFSEVNMKVQRLHQTNFLCYAFGGPNKFLGKDLRSAHAHLKLKEEDFTAITDNLLLTLKKFKISEDKIKEVMDIVATTHDEILNL